MMIKEGDQVMCGHCNATYCFRELNPHTCIAIIGFRLKSIIEKLDEIINLLNKDKLK